MKIIKMVSDITLKTSEQWYEKYKDKLTILDPDGWDRKNYNYSWFEELITEREFNHRASCSTISILK